MMIWLTLGRALMLGVWCFMLFNLVQPFPRPLNVFMNIAMIFTLLMHGCQILLLKHSQPKDSPPLSRMQQIRILLFGIFELLTWLKRPKR